MDLRGIHNSVTEKGNHVCQANSCSNKFSGLVNDQRAEGRRNNDSMRRPNLILVRRLGYGWPGRG